MSNINPLRYGKDILWQVEHAKEKNLWYVGYMLIHFLHGKLSYFPNQSLVVNVGKDVTAQNSRFGVQDDIARSIMRFR